MASLTTPFEIINQIGVVHIRAAGAESTVREEFIAPTRAVADSTAESLYKCVMTEQPLQMPLLEDSALVEQQI